MKQLYPCESVVTATFVGTEYLTRWWGWLLGQRGYGISIKTPYNYSNDRRNQGRTLKTLLDAWDRNRSKSGPTPWQLIIISIIIIISFMQGIYTYIPKTNYIPREYSVAANLLLLFMVLISLVSVLNLLYFYISTFRSMCAVPNIAVFCSSLTSCFPGMLLTYYLNEFEILPVVPIITGITFAYYYYYYYLYNYTI